MDWKSKDYLYYKILQFHIENDVRANIDLEALCKKNNWHLVPYPNKQLQTLKTISKDGFTVKDKNNFFIFYNPELKQNCYGRYRFTIAHEIGHIYLYHHLFVNNEILMYTDKKGAVWEDHANIFAQNALLPIKYKKYYKNNNTRDIQNKFNVSREMVITRLGKMYKDELFARKIIAKIRTKGGYLEDINFFNLV